MLVIVFVFVFVLSIRFRSYIILPGRVRSRCRVRTIRRIRIICRSRIRVCMRARSTQKERNIVKDLKMNSPLMMTAMESRRISRQVVMISACLSLGLSSQISVNSRIRCVVCCSCVDGLSEFAVLGP